MYDLPLFPLNTVLFPGTPISLHIFEERYKLMMNRCLEQKTPFGVVLIDEGEEALGSLARPHTVGCTARVQQVQPMAEGRMNILAIGQERFRIVNLKDDQPYLVGEVESFPLAGANAAAVTGEMGELRPLVLQYLEILTRVGDVDLDPTQLPEEPLRMAYLAAALLRVPTAKKQQILGSPSARRMLRLMRHYYREEIDVMQLIPADQQGPFSLN